MSVEFDLEDGGQVGADDVVEEQQEEKNGKATTPAPVTIAPVDVGPIASQIVSAVMSSLSAQAQNANGGQRRQTELERWAQQQLNDKVDESIVKRLVGLQMAGYADNAQRTAAEKHQEKVDNFNLDIWKDVHEIFDNFDEQIPGGIGDAKEALTREIHKELMTNPDFAEDRNKISQMLKPSKKSLQRASAIVIDRKLKREGRQRGQMPIDRAPKVASQPQASDPLSTLTKSQRAYYDAFKSEYKGAEKELLKIAKGM